MASWWTLSVLLVAQLATSQLHAAAKPDRRAFAASVCAAVDKAAASNNIDRVFFARLLWKESLFDPNAVSPVGAEGIAQFMPGTAERRKLADPFDPLAAISASAHFLADLKKQFGNIGLAAGAYNAGEGRIINWLAGKGGMPLETQDYVAFITGKAIEEWKESTANHAMPALGKQGDFAAQCMALASREVTLRSSGVRRSRGQPWGALLVTDFNESKAMALFQRLKLRFPDVLKGAEPFVIRKKNLSRGSKRIAYVMMGAKTQRAAIDLCLRYRDAGIPCVVRKGG
jgi:Transglycosylase SLT domain